MTMLINMIGSDHVKEGTNKQDMAFQIANAKVVLDGCGSGKYSEVGATLFMHYFTKEYDYYLKNPNASLYEDFSFDEIIEEVIVREFFEQTLDMYESSKVRYLYNDNTIYNNFLFTILICVETEEEFIVYSCGDGFILTLDKEDKFGMTELEALDEYPAYYAYNFIQNKQSMLAHEDGVKFEKHVYSKEEYKKVGVASDGIRFVRELFANDRDEFNSYIKSDRTGKAEMFIKKNQNPFKLYNKKGESKENIFKDDISIVF